MPWQLSLSFIHIYNLSVSLPIIYQYTIYQSSIFYFLFHLLMYVPILKRAIDPFTLLKTTKGPANSFLFLLSWNVWLLWYLKEGTLYTTKGEIEILTKLQVLWSTMQSFLQEMLVQWRHKASESNLPISGLT